MSSLSLSLGQFRIFFPSLPMVSSDVLSFQGHGSFDLWYCVTLSITHTHHHSHSQFHVLTFIHSFSFIFPVPNSLSVAHFHSVPCNANHAHYFQTESLVLIDSHSFFAIIITLDHALSKTVSHTHVTLPILTLLAIPLNHSPSTDFPIFSPISLNNLLSHFFSLTFLHSFSLFLSLSLIFQFWLSLTHVICFILYLSHSHTLSHSPSLTFLLFLSLSFSQSLSLLPPLSLPLSVTHSLTHFLTHSFPLCSSLSFTLSLYRTLPQFFTVSHSFSLAHSLTHFPLSTPLSPTRPCCSTSMSLFNCWIFSSSSSSDLLRRTVMLRRVSPYRKASSERTFHISCARSPHVVSSVSRNDFFVVPSLSSLSSLPSSLLPPFCPPPPLLPPSTLPPRHRCKSSYL